MRIWKSAGSASAIMIISIVSSIAITTIMSKILLNVSEPNHKIATLKEGRSGLDRLVLPASSFAIGVQEDDSIQGVFSVSTGAALDPIHIFLPYYVGSIDISIGEESIYSSPFPRGARFIPKVHNVEIEIISVDLVRKLGPAKNVDISISVFPDGGGLAVLSEIYVGKPQEFATLLQKNYLYYDVARIAVFGVQIFLLLLGVTLLRSANIRHELLAPLLILAYLTSFGAAAVVSQIWPDINISSYFISCSPIISVALLLYGWRTCGGTTTKSQRTAIYSFMLTWFTFIVAANLLNVELMFLNVYVAAPSIVIAMTLVAVMSARSLSTKRSAEVQVMLFGVIFLMLLTAHDITFRVMLHSNAVAMSPLGSLAFFAVVSSSAVRRYFVSQKGLAEANATLKEALETQSSQLAQEFAKTAHLMRRSASQEETARLTQELHDGVLTYLSLINVISESDTIDSKEQIGHLSRIATNEIRVILDSRPNDSASLAIALSSLRENMVDSLSLQNIDVEWSIVELLNYGPLPPKLLMDVVRIVQEALHNAVVRAKCRSLSIVAEESEGTYAIRISNLGGKTYSSEERPGHGIANMRDRATKIGGSLSIVSKDTGASLLLELPKMKSENLS